MEPRHDAPAPTWDDADRVLREELAQLPRPYRVPLELCYLDGLTHEEAADQLGWPVGTVKTRLVRGRRQLRERLDRRGVALGAALLLLFLPRSSTAALSQPLIDSTVHAMNLQHSGQHAALSAGFPRATSLAARSLTRLANPWRLGPLLALLALLLGATQGIASYSSARAAEFEAFAALPPGLTDVLNVDCR